MSKRIQAEGKMFSDSKKERGGAGCKHREIQGSLYAQGEGHGKAEQKQEDAAEERGEAREKSENQGQAKKELGQGGGPRQGRDDRGRCKPIELGGVSREVGEISPSDVGLACGSPKAEAVRDGGEKTDSQCEAQKHGTIVGKTVQGIHSPSQILQLKISVDDCRMLEPNARMRFFIYFVANNHILL